MAINKTERRFKIRKGIRKNLAGTADRPRLSVFKSNTAVYAQLIDDLSGKTLVSASSKELGSTTSANMEISKEVGKKIAEKAVSEGISSVVFDRSGYIYHGKVKALADGAREGGLKF
ncbi:50S ribosomal protein L18 [Penaeicola halotolerans]|uniref:50S ribosomal protein L18 n=1 Tax=Penaeicola halotolerans TaxID=2793196 RepID=UPI001CF8211D|nr:50S ribosomal protein L18 [Penaeicola halotolerans]